MNRQSFLLGLFVGISIFLLIGAAMPKNEVGRYQIAGAGTSKSVFVLDTKTGALVHAWIKKEIPTNENYIPGSSIRELLNKE